MGIPFSEGPDGLKRMLKINVMDIVGMFMQEQRNINALKLRFE